MAVKDRKKPTKADPKEKVRAAGKAALVAKTSGKTSGKAVSKAASKSASKAPVKSSAKTAGKAVAKRAAVKLTAKATAPKTSAKKPVAKAPVATKSVAKASAGKKAVGKKVVGRTVAVKAPAAKARALKGAASANAKASAKSIAKTTAKAKKPLTKALAKSAAGKKPATKKVVAQKAVAKKTVAKKAVAKKTVAKAVAKKAVAQKPVSKKTVAKKAVATKAVAKKAVAKKVAGKKPVAKTPVARAPIAKKPTAKATAKATAKSTAKSTSKTAAKNKVPAKGVSDLAAAAGRSASRTARGVTRTVKRATRSIVRAVTPAARPAGRPSAVAAARTAAAKPVAAKPAAKPAAKAVVKAAAKPAKAAKSRALPLVKGVKITGEMAPRFDEILTPAALSFVADLHRRFDKTRRELLAARVAQQERYDAGELPDFLPETQEIRDGDWKVGPIPADLLDRRVEITGPVDRKMVINALNCGAKVYMADFEDANSPTWANNLEGQVNMKDRWAGTLGFYDPRNGKTYAVSDDPAVLVVRPRGWHLTEDHLTIDGQPVSGGLFDFGLYVFHNAQKQRAQGTAPYFYLPKLETHLEARLWNDVFVFAQERLGIPVGTMKATVLIETLPAAFEMDEILYELREHIAGLNAGRWDYIFSFIKKLSKNENYVLPDRSQVVMGQAFLGAYAALLVKTCHRRGAFAMGGMAAQIPIKNDPAANAAAFDKVKADKEREVRDGCDGTWVAHPDLVPVATEVFDRMMPQPNQLDRQRDDVNVTQADLLELHRGERTEEGFRLNIRVGVQYIEAWLRGRGAVPIYNLMEDAATAEISRAQIWQWIKYGVELDGRTPATPELFRRAMDEEMQRVRGELGADVYDAGRFPEAIKLFTDLSLAPEFEDFLTIPAYRLIA